MAERFRWILDTVPDWWKSLEGVQINVALTIAAVPNCPLIHPGDWVIREPDGRVCMEPNYEGRIEAQRYLQNLKHEVNASAK
jgi:hypothetical protein